MALKQITAQDFKEAVEWLLEQDCGCYHKVLGTTDDGTKLCFVVGWSSEHGYDNSDIEANGFPSKDSDGRCICSEIGYQHRNNAMQTDIDWDFLMPYDKETGDVWDTFTMVSNEPAAWEDDAQTYNEDAQKIWDTYCVPNDDGVAPIDLMESKKSEDKKSEDMLSRRDAMEKAKQIVSSLKPSASACKSVGLSLAQVKKAFADFNKAYNSKSYVGMSTYDFGDLLSNVANYAYVGGDNSGAMEIMDLAKSALSESKQSKGCSMKRKIESLAKSKAVKKSEAISASSIRVDPYDIAVKVQEVNTYTSTSGASLTAEVPAVEAWFNDLSEFKDCVDGLAENCNGYADISRDGSDILVEINAPKDDESGDYETIVELRCSTEITHASLEGVVDLLNNA